MSTVPQQIFDHLQREGRVKQSQLYLRFTRQQVYSAINSGKVKAYVSHNLDDKEYFLAPDAMRPKAGVRGRPKLPFERMSTPALRRALEAQLVKPLMVKSVLKHFQPISPNRLFKLAERIGVFRRSVKGEEYWCMNIFNDDAV